MANAQTAVKQPTRGLLEVLTSRVQTIPVITVIVFALLLLGGFTKLLPADFVNKLFKYVGGVY